MFYTRLHTYFTNHKSVAEWKKNTKTQVCVFADKYMKKVLLSGKVSLVDYWQNQQFHIIKLYDNINIFCNGK